MAKRKLEHCRRCGALCARRAVFCSRLCAALANAPKRIRRKPRPCEHCSKTFSPKNYQVSQGRGRFCSTKCHNKSQAKPIEDKFWPYVSKARPGCWKWSGTLDRDGYGVVTHNRKQLRASRVSYMFHHGEIPKGQQVCHTCDNRGCVNPKHLFLGNNLDNIADKVAKGRQYRKLTGPQVRQIKQMLRDGYSVPFVAGDFGVTTGAIYPIAKGKTWRHIS